MSLDNPLGGYTPAFRIAHAPYDIEFVQDANRELVSLGAGASGFDSATGLSDFGNIAPKQGWFYWHGHPVLGPHVGGWFQTALTRVFGVRADDSVDLIRVYASGADVTNSGVLTSSATGTPGVLFAKDDLVLAMQDEGGKTFAVPGQIALVSDGVTLGSGAANFSTRIRRASGAGLETLGSGSPFYSSGISPVERPLNDIIGVFDAPVPDIAGGETAPSHLAGLVMFQDEGASAGYSQRCRIATPTAGGYLTDVLRYQHDTASIASGLAIRTDAEFWTATQTVPPDGANKGGPLNFQTATLTIVKQFASSFATSSPVPPWKESQLVHHPSFDVWHALSPAVTMIASGTAGHCVSSGAHNRRWTDIFQFASTEALAIRHSAAIVNPSTGSSAILSQLIRVAPDKALPALNITSGVVFDAGVDVGGSMFLRQTFKNIKFDNASGSTMSGMGFNASGHMWTSGGASAPIATRLGVFKKAFRGSLGGEALGVFVFSHEIGSETFTNASNAEDFTPHRATSGVFFRPMIPLPRQDPTIFGLTIIRGDPYNAPIQVFASSTTWGTDHYKYIININSFSGTPATVYLGSAGSYRGYVHNLGTTNDILLNGTRVAAWYNFEQEDWVCVVRDQLVLTSPDGAQWEVIVNNSGVLGTTAVT